MEDLKGFGEDLLISGRGDGIKTFWQGNDDTKGWTSLYHKMLIFTLQQFPYPEVVLTFFLYPQNK